MKRLSHRGQLALFVGAILVPSAILVVVGQRTIQQARELAEKRRLDERRPVKERTARELLARLEELKGQDSRLALVAAVENGKLLAPWESDPAVRRFRQLTTGGGFGAAISRAERAEYAASDPASAIRDYREAIAAAGSPEQAAYARLLLARALEKQSRKVEAAAEARQALSAPLDFVDEDGVPLAVQAAALLASSPGGRDSVRRTLSAAVEARRWPSPMATFALSTIADQLEAGAPPQDRPWVLEFRARIAAAIRFQEQVQALQNDAARLGLLDAPPAGARPPWKYYTGADPWLVAAEPGPRGELRVVAVRARDVFEPLEAAGNLRFLAPGETGGELLGDNFPGVQVRFPPEPPAPAASRVESALYYLALFALVAATAFGATLLWGSLRREMQLSEMRSQFVASVSHELKTPLTAIRMFAETLDMRRTEDEQVRHDYLQTIVNECERLSRLVDDVLLFSKIEQGKKVYRFRPVSLADVVRRAARTLSYPLAQRGFDLRMSLDEDLPAVEADADALEQAVLNLLSNAMKYSGERREIDLRLAREGGEAAIEVRDYGLGVAPEEQERIFDKYYRVPSPENQTIPGTGLGLTLVAQIVKAHGGRVDLKSAPGQGSAFTIRLGIGNGS